MMIKLLPFLFPLLLFSLAGANVVDDYDGNGGLVSPEKLEMFVDELPDMPKVNAFRVKRGGGAVPVTARNITIGMYQKKWKFHRDLPPTTVFAFGSSNETATIPGPTIEAIQGIPTYMTWKNHLPSKHILPSDPTIPTADSHLGGVPTVVHLHGGIHPPASDGHSTAWFTSSFRSTGPSFVSPVSFYPNIQDSGNLWYHDHAMGLTRVNLLAGLLGSYVIRNPNLEGPLNLPSGARFDRQLVVFDRSFRTDGSLFLNSTGNNPSIHPQWQPEYFGDAIIVNGKAWPKLHVARRKYRFRIINASNARFYRFYLSNGLTFVHVGSDSNYLYKPVASTNFLLAPSEIADVVVDFSRSTTDSAVLANDAPYPYPTGDPTDEFNGKVMKFIIQKSKTIDPTEIPRRLMMHPPPAAAPPRRAVRTRYIVMYEFESATGEPTHLLLNNKTFDDPVTETPKEGTSEVWYVINLTEDNHPLHIHLGLFVALQQRELEDLDGFKDCMAKRNDAAGCGLGRHARGKKAAVPEYERGWKNVFKMMPGYVTKILVRFSMLTTGPAYPFDATAEPGYVYHCHILDHEDNVMMRPLKLIA